MSGRLLGLILLALTAAFAVQAGNVEGTVVIQYKLTKRKVTASADTYERSAR